MFELLLSFYYLLLLLFPNAVGALPCCQTGKEVFQRREALLSFSKSTDCDDCCHETSHQYANDDNDHHHHRHHLNRPILFSSSYLLSSPSHRRKLLFRGISAAATALTTTTVSTNVLLPIQPAWCNDEKGGSDAGFATSTTSSTPIETRQRVQITLESPLEQPLGIGLAATKSPNPRLVVQDVVAVSSSSSPLSLSVQQVRPGMILEQPASITNLAELQKALQEGPYPLTLTFVEPPTFKIIVTQPPPPLSSDSPSTIRSRRDDILEIVYTAQYEVPAINNNNKTGGQALSSSSSTKTIIYDASEFRGTGLPYFMVLGSGDMLPGVDQGLVNMQPGEERRLIIPPLLGYGPKGNAFYGVPPDATLIWDVKLVSVNGEK